MDKILAHRTVDAKEMACPMPIVRTKKAMETLEAGHVLEVLATDPGSKADIKAWSENAGHQYLGTLEEEGVLKHYLRKLTEKETEEKTHPDVVNNNELKERMANDEELTVIDVRESAEYAFNHIPNTVNIPFEELENHIHELDQNREIYLLCRTGNRSDMAAQKLTQFGFNHVYNVVPGISEWANATKSIKQEERKQNE